jgi:hypothetical protein
MSEENEMKIKELLINLYSHVGAMPWKDITFVRSTVAQAAAQDQIVLHTLEEIKRVVEQDNEQ